MDTHDIITAASNPAMNTYRQEDATEAVRSGVDRAYGLADVALPDAILYEQMVKDVTDKILRSYPYITSQEFVLVCESGVAGELGGRTKPNTAVIFGWLANYVNGDLRKEAIRNYRRGNRQDPSTTPLTRAEVDELNRAATVRAINVLWREYRDTGRLADDHLDGYCAMAMDGCIERDLFSIGEEHWKAAKEYAAKQYRRQNGLRGIGAVLNYSPVFKTKRRLLEMCFAGQKATGRDLIVSA